jgi:microcystin-dependent protein
MKIDLIFLIVLFVISIYTYCNCNVKENFDDTIVYDIESMRNLASISNKIMTIDGLKVYGDINFSNDGKSNDGKSNEVKSNDTEIMPIGSIIAYPSINIPDGWLKCDGSIIADTTTYKTLCDIIKSKYGTLNQLPNLNNKVLVGASDTKILGSTGGEEDHILSINEIPSHTHVLDNYSHSHNYSTFNDTRWFCDGNDDHPNIINAGQNTGAAGKHNHTMGSNGGNASGTVDSHTNMMPYLVTNYIIRGK